MVSYILMSLFVAFISLCLGGIPIIVFLIMLESGGLIDYALAFTLLVASAFELIKFIFFLTMDKIFEFDIKDIIFNIKSFFKRSKKNKTAKIDADIPKGKTKLETSTKLKIFQVIFVLIFVVIAIFHKPHSMLLDVIYDNLIVRILYYIFIPLVICDLINQIKDGVIDGLDGFFSGILMSAGIPLLLGVILSTSFVFTSKIMYEDVLENKIKPLFVYENLGYDEIRSSEEFSNEYDFLKNSFTNKITELKTKYDINDTNSYQNLKNILFRDTDIVSYGYSVTDKEWENDDTVLLCIVDKKTRDHKIYKLNFRNNTFVLSNDEEFENVRQINYENKKNK